MKKRFIRNRVRRGKKGSVDLEINSLLDILVILLVFLIKSYGGDEVQIKIPQFIKVPISKSQDSAQKAVTVKMAKDKRMWVDQELVLDKNSYQNIISTQKIDELYEKLLEKRREFEILQKQTKQAAEFSGVVNLIMDKKLPYDYIRKIMVTSTEAGFKEFKFIVIGEE